MTSEPRTNAVVTKQPGEEEEDRISYVDSDTHAREYCCCLHGWGSGPDPRWYYPWDKGVYRLWGVCCMWYCMCTFVPCVLINKNARDIICCSDQCGDDRVKSRDDKDVPDEIPEA